VIFIGQKWVNMQLLHSVIKHVANKEGWVCSKKNRIYIQCNCYQDPEKNPDKQSFAVSLKKNCQWEARVKPLDRKYTAVVTKNNSTIKCPMLTADIPIMITKVCFIHGDSCKPSPQYQIAAKSRSGAYTKGISIHAMYSLCTILKHEGCLRSRTIKAILQ